MHKQDNDVAQFSYDNALEEHQKSGKLNDPRCSTPSSK
jgi:hypothetical protein